MKERNQILRVLARHSGWILRVGLFAAALAAAGALLVPATWESTVVLLPPDRRAADFRYVNPGRGSDVLRGPRIRLSSLQRPGELHPLDVWEAVLGSPEMAGRLVDRFDLAKRWAGGDRREAVRELQKALSFEAVPYSGYEIRFRSADAELSADLANAAVEVLEARIRELYRDDVEAEREFLAQASHDRIEEALRVERRVAAGRASSGIVDEESQREQADDLSESFAIRIADARTERARMAIDHGVGSSEERDAAFRVRELERAAARLPVLLQAPGQLAAESELEHLGRAARQLAALKLRTIEHQAGHDVALRVLDPALPAERGDRSGFLAVLLALLVVPAAVVGWRLLERLVDQLAPEVPGLSRFRAAADRLANTLGSRRAAQLGAAAGAAVLGHAFAAQPLALVGVLGVVFLIVLMADLRAAWFLLVIALPWAWDYVNEGAGFQLQFPTEPGMILLSLAWAYAAFLRPQRVPREPLLVAAAVLFGWMVVCTTTSVFVKHSLFQLVSVGGFVLVGLAFPLLEIRRVEEVERVVRGVLVWGAVCSVVGVVQVFRSSLPLHNAAFHIGHGFLYNHGPFAAYLGFAMGPAFVYLLTERWSVRLVPVLAVAVLTTAATIISLSRAGWLSMAALLVALAALRARVFLRKMALPLGLAAVALAIVFLRSPLVTQGLQNYVEVSVSADYGSNVDRLQRWVAALRMVAARPVTGVGPGAYEMAYDTYKDFEFEGGRRGTHSEILRAASEQGVPGLVFLIFLFVVVYRTGFRLIRTAEDPRIRRLAAALCAGLFTYVVHGQFNEYWRLNKVALMIWVFIGLLGALDRLARERDGTAAPPVAAS